ncbi:unnamed protein product, partial [Staurois parvus]
MCPLHRPRPSPPADAGSCVAVPVTSGRTGAAGSGKLENFLKNVIFFKTILHMLCPVPCLHFECSF